MHSTDNTGIVHPVQIMQGYTTHTTENTEIDDFHYRQYRDRWLPLQTIQGKITSTTDNTGTDDFHYRQYRDSRLPLQTIQR